MGILNVTPDSFSDAGSFFLTKKRSNMGAVWPAMERKLWTSGESPPGRAPSRSHRGGDRRVVPVVAALSSEGIRVSIDTGKPEVMAAAVAAGACCINDVCLTQPGALDVAVGAKRSCVSYAHAGDAGECRRIHNTMTSWLRFISFSTIGWKPVAGRVCLQERLIVDPGFGFGRRKAIMWRCLRLSLSF